MTFSEACDACQKHRIVYHAHYGACTITYTSAGGEIRDEGIADIRPLNKTDLHRVNVEDLKFKKDLV